VREALAQRGFGEVIERVEDLARRAGEADDWSDIAQTYDRTRSAILDAMADVDASQRNDPEFVARVLLAILYQSRHEYEEAIEDGRFVHAHEYQDARGFMQTGRDLLRWKERVLRQADGAAYEEVVARFEAAMEAWPTPQPPATPVLSISELYGRVSAVEFALSRY